VRAIPERERAENAEGSSKQRTEIPSRSAAETKLERCDDYP